MSEPGPAVETEGRTGPMALTGLLLAYLAVAAVMTWPLIASTDRYVVSEHMDSVTAFYNLWWFEKSICDLKSSPWTSPLIDYPHDYSMVMYPIWVPYDALALPVVHAMGLDGLPVAFNLIYVLSFAACGLAAFVMVRYLTRDPSAAFVAGLILAFLPYRFWNVTRWHVTCLELVAPCIYFFIRMVRGDSRLAAPGFAISATLLAYMSPSYAADVTLALAIVLAWMAIAEREHLLARATWIRLVGASAAVLVLCSPLAVRIGMDVAGKGETLSAGETIRVPYSANLMGYAAPGYTQRAYSRLMEGREIADTGLAREHGIVGYEMFAGYVALLLAAVGACALRRRAAPLTALAFVFVILSLGPRLHVGQWTSGFSAPYAWLEPLLPWLRVERAPARHAGVAYVALAALAGLGLAHLRSKLGSGKRTALVVLAGLAVLLESFQAPLPVDRIPIPDFVREIKADPVPGSVLDLPHLPLVKRFAGIHQMNHERPLAIQLTRRVEDPDYHASPLHKYLDRPRDWLEFDDAERARALDETRAEFALREIRYVVAYTSPKFMEAEDLAGLRMAMAALGAEEKFIDGNYVVYRMTDSR